MQTSVNTETVLVQEPIKLSLALSEHCESKIRAACQVFPDNEWSGAAFYRYKCPDECTDMKKTTLEIVDFCLQDIGSATYTEYGLDKDTAAYFAEHIDSLMGCKVCLLHSHNSMTAFFSGTDTSTLKEQAAQCNNVLSLVVNNEGKYVAKFTERHMIHDTTHTASTTDTKDFWMHMGEHPDYTLSTKSKDWEDNRDSVEIHCWDCDIQRPLDVAIDENFRRECLDKAELFRNRKTEPSVEMPHSFREWQDTGRFLPDYYYRHRSADSNIREMVYSISNLSFNDYNYYWNKYLLSDTYDETFLAAFMDAWYYYFLPDPEEIDKVKKTFLKWSLDGADNCRHVRTIIADILDDLRVKAIEENAYVQ